MKILPINNIQNNRQQNFKAKFSKKDIKEILKETEGGDIDLIPKLYTMLDIIKNHSGKRATIKHVGCWHEILIDGKSMNNGLRYFAALHALTDATVNHKNTLLKETPIKRLSEDEFESAYCKNSKKTVQDIENSFAEG